jgi:DnaJ-class molecular chaperone
MTEQNLATCPVCNGTGNNPGDIRELECWGEANEIMACDRCKGTGYLIIKLEQPRKFNKGEL